MKISSTSDFSLSLSWHGWKDTTFTTLLIFHCQPQSLISSIKLLQPWKIPAPTFRSPLLTVIHLSETRLFPCNFLNLITEVSHALPINRSNCVEQPFLWTPPSTTLFSIMLDFPSPDWQLTETTDLFWTSVRCLSLALNLILTSTKKVVWLYPLTAITSFEDNDTLCLHTCLSVKTWYRFGQDHADCGTDWTDEPSSGDNDNSDSGLSQWPSEVQENSHIVHSVASTSTSAPIHQASNTQANPIQPSSSFALLKSVPAKIWASYWAPSPGRYVGQMTLCQPMIEQAYLLAVGEDHSSGLHISGRSLTVLMDQFKECLGDAAERGDFTEILHPEQSFVMCIPCLIIKKMFANTSLALAMWVELMKQFLLEMALNMKWFKLSLWITREAVLNGSLNTPTNFQL